MSSRKHIDRSLPALAFLALFLASLTLRPQARDSVELRAAGGDSIYSGPLISEATGMETAWDIPKNPLVDSLLPADKHLAEQVRRGFDFFTNTSKTAPRFSGNTLSCSNCHLNAGQREKALPLVGIGAAFPEYNKRQGRLISLEDRIVGCFERSMNSTGVKQGSKRVVVRPSNNDHEVLAISSYLTWLSRGMQVGEKLPWRGLNAIPSEKLIPVKDLDPGVGKRLFLEKCTNCHGDDGQGVEIGDKKAGPLWGPNSWNDGAGAARVYTLAGMIRYMMPYLAPGSLTDEEAQQIAAFITSQPRPKYPFKAGDYTTEPLPADAVYYKR